jgi:DNA helicase HerA-like ATPase
MANRHGLVTGATGTGKTVTLQRLAEGLSRIGVPVFAADIKGDLSGISQAGKEQPKIKERVEQLGLTDFVYADCPVTFWDVFGEQGHPVRATTTDLGQLLLSRMLNLNDVQSGVLQIAFKIAADKNWLLLDLKDMQALLQHIADQSATYKTQYGNISAASVGAIQRGLLMLDQQGGAKFLGEPALDLMDFIQTDSKGRGVVNILAADKLMAAPALYSAFLLWMLTELQARLPEVGDQEKPKLVFFFDEAHLLFTDAPTALVDKIEQVARLIRSKGVGVFFVTQSPLDIPDKVLGQLGNRVQHALRAFTPRDQKAVKAAAETFRQNPRLNAAETIMQLGVGEALVSMLDAKGMPQMVERSFIVPAGGQIGPITPEQRQAIIKASILFGHYEQAIDRESAYEILKKRSEQAGGEVIGKAASKKPGFFRKIIEAFTTTFTRSLASAASRQVYRVVVAGVLGKLLGGAGATSKRRTKRDE